MVDITVWILTECKYRLVYPLFDALLHFERFPKEFLYSQGRGIQIDALSGTFTIRLFCDVTINVPVGSERVG